MSDETDVVVVGGGLAGLSTAERLRAGGARVVVLEARDRVGGRTWSKSLHGATFDVGGQWLGPSQHRARALAAELGLALFPTHVAGAKIVEVDGEVSRYKAPVPLRSVGEAFSLVKGLVSMELGRRRIDPADPAAARNAAELDDQNLGEWMAKVMPSSSARGLMAAATRVVFGAEPEEVSLLYFLFYLSSAGGILPLIDTKGGAQQDRFVTGAQQLSIGVAARLGDSLRLGAPVQRIAQDGDGVTVSAAGLTVRARRAVVALAPALCDKLVVAPGWPATRVALMRSMGMGATTKFLLFYPRPFWRQAGLSGEAVSTRGPITVTFDNCNPDGTIACLVAFAVGQPARALGKLSEAERRAAVLGAVVRLFGADAASPIDVVEQDWQAEPWTTGCPVAVANRGGFLAGAAALREPVGRLHFAGTETARQWAGYLEGALESAERVAPEVLAALS